MTCPTCGTPFEARRRDHRFCTAKCRLEAFTQRKAQAQAERDAQCRLLLTTALEAVSEAKELLREEP